MADKVPVIFKVDQDPTQSVEAIQRASRIILNGGVVAFPTETFNGLAALALDERALQQIYLLKGRPPHKSLSILVADVTELQHCVHHIPAEARELMARFWPGPLTLVFQATEHLPGKLTAGTGKIGVRISPHPVAHALERCA